MPSIYVFSSEWTDHIALGASHCIWKVRMSESRVNQWLGRAASISRGDFGVFYDSQTNKLTVPFVFASSVYPASDDDPFPKGGPYRIEFRLFPLGPQKRAILRADLPEAIQKAVKPANQFVAVSIENEQWLRLIEKLTEIQTSGLEIGSAEEIRLFNFLGGVG